MPTVQEYTDPYLWIYRRVPPFGSGVCEICHGAPGEGFTVCHSCYRTMGQVSHPADLVLPISLYRGGGQLAHVLWNYKNGPPSKSRQRHQLQVAATLARFITGHGACIRNVAGEEWDRITIVPSSQGREGPHPLEEAIGRARALQGSYVHTLQGGSKPITHLEASDEGYAPCDVKGMRLLLVDDTYTSGARVHSAASALHLAGARVIAVVVVGRRINPGYSPETQALWNMVDKAPFSFDTCCLE